jgi:hypothetical protein
MSSTNRKNDNIGTRIKNAVSAYNPFASGVDERIITRRPNFTSAFTNFGTGVSNRINTIRPYFLGETNIPSHGEGVDGRIETQRPNTIDNGTSFSPSYEVKQAMEQKGWTYAE